MQIRQILSAAVILGIACAPGVANEGDEETTQPAAAVVAAAQPKATPAASTAKASIRGSIKFEGDVPKLERVDLTPDPFCANHHSGAGMESANGIRVGSGGGLKDVFVQLTSGVPDEKYEVPDTPVELDQRGCTYVPHVFGIMKRQPLKILNSDATLHNIHAMPKSNKEFNLAMPNKDDVREQKFKKAEDAVLIKCDVHPWMATYAFVMEHPFYATTGDDGAFRIEGPALTDGEYGVKLWHDTLGTHEGTVTVKDGEGSFEFTWKQ
jgi:hypothetical protein